MPEQLHGAASRGDLTAMNSLISSQLDTGTSNPPEHTRLERKSSFIHRLFGRSSSGGKRLLGTSSSSFTENEDLLEYINMPNQYGMSALHAACFHGQFHAVQLLLFHGADPNKQTQQISSEPSWTFPLHIASFNGNLRVVECLLDAGADPYLLDFRGWGAAEVAERAKHGKVAKLVRDHVKKRVMKLATVVDTPLIRHYCKNKPIENTSCSNHSAADLLIDKDEDIPKPEFRSLVDLNQIGIDETFGLPGGPWDRDDMYCNSRLKKLHSRDEVFLGQ